MSAHHHWTAEQEALLGTMSDADAAEIIGVHANSAGARRRRLCVPKYGQTGVRLVWTPEMDEAVRTLSNTEVARRYGISHVSVLHRRRELGLPPSRHLPPQNKRRSQ